MTNPHDDAAGSHGADDNHGDVGQQYGQGGYDPNQYGQGGYDPNQYGQRPVQGYGANALPAGAKPQNYKVPSIISAITGFLFSCFLGLPAGIAAIVFSNKVDSEWANGNARAAEEASRRAKLWMIVAYVFSALGLIANIVIFANNLSGM